MKITLHRLNDKLHFQAENEAGKLVELDAGAHTDLGEGAAMSPMQLVLTAVGGCSVFDIVSILHKQRQPLRDVKVVADAERVDAVPAPFKTIHLHYDLFGELDEAKVARAVQLGVEKYCSVATMLTEVEITYDFTIHP